MREELALVTFTASVVLLLLLEPATVPLSEVKELGKTYHTCGVLVPIKELERGCIYRVMDENVEVKGIAFFGECTSGYSCFYGRLEEYRGEREVVILGYS